MSRVFVAEAVIQRPVQQVWNVLTDWTQTPHWMFGITSGAAEPADICVGQTIRLMANGKPTTMEVGECDPPDFVQLVVDQSGMVTHWDYALDAVTDAVTHLELTVWCEIPGWKAITAPAVHMILRRGGAGQPAALANHIEGQ